MKRWILGFLAVLTLAAVIVGAPVALLSWGRLPHLDRGLAGPVADGSLLLGVLTVLGWAAWLVFTLATAVEAVSLGSGRRLRLPGLRAVQRLAGGLLLLVLTLLPAATTDDDNTRTVAVAIAVPEAPAVDAAARTIAPDSGPQASAATSSARYTVQPGDDLWSIADRLLGDGREWRRIAALNPALSEPTASLVPGSELVLPEHPTAAALAAPAKQPAAAEVQVRVHKGDTLSALAEQHLGAAGRWPRIAEANPIVTDPDHIEIGWTLRIPGARAHTERSSADDGSSGNGSVGNGSSGYGSSGYGSVGGGSVGNGSVGGSSVDGRVAQPDALQTPTIQERGTPSVPVDRTSMQTAAAPSSPAATGSAASASATGSSAPATASGPATAASATGPSDAGSAAARPGSANSASAATGSGPASASATASAPGPSAAGSPTGSAAVPTTAGSLPSSSPQTPGPAASAAGAPADRGGATPGHSSANPAPAESPSVPDDGLPLHAPLTVGTLAAAALVGTLEARRALRDRTRPVGRRRPPASAGADRLRTQLRSEQRPASLDGLAAALRRIGRHVREADLDLPELAAVRVRSDVIEFEWAEATTAPPSGFGGDAACWLAPLPFTDDSDQPCPYPALVSLGTGDGGEVLLVDAERSRVLGVAGTPELQVDALSAMGVELACAPWSSDVRMVVIGAGGELVQLAGEERVQLLDAEAAIGELRAVVAARREALASGPLGRLRTDPDRADAVAPYVFLFLDAPDAADLAGAERLLAGDPVGVALIVPTSSSAPALWQVSGDPNRPDGTLAGSPGSFAAHAITAAARASLGELLTDYEPVTAPWWTDDNVYPLPRRAEDDVDIIRLTGARHPRLLLVGPVELEHAAGPEPARARQQLLELCAWLLENPGSTATRMTAGMALADSTRRSNLSRLRAWLGTAPDGTAYLPDAYSGWINLHAGVTSDWRELQTMLLPGIDRLPDATLVAALDLVRGAPLADAAPGQWHWAEELRTEISGALRDVGVVLTERALRNHDIDLARWAASRALSVAPEDELLLCARLSTEYQAGSLDECERLVNQLTRQARVLGVDLMPETVDLCQQVVEGKLRARA